MKLCKIKDNSQIKKVEFSDIENLTRKIADKTVEQLEFEDIFVFPEITKNSAGLTKEQMILETVNDTFRSGNLMGFLGCSDERLIIESRFCGENEDWFFGTFFAKCWIFQTL